MSLLCSKVPKVSYLRVITNATPSPPSPLTSSPTAAPPYSGSAAPSPSPPHSGLLLDGPSRTAGHGSPPASPQLGSCAASFCFRGQSGTETFVCLLVVVSMLPAVALEQWLPPEGNFAPRGTFLVVTTLRGGCYWPRVGRGQQCQ